MKVASVLLLGLLSRSNAVGSSSLRGDAAAKEDPLGQFACTLKGGKSQSTCDSSKSEDGSQCVWCAVATFGVCVSDDIASQMEQTIPGIDCDDNKGGSDDDAAPAPDEDDDAAPQDDDVPSDYWTCLEKHAGSKDCTDAGCAWCQNKGGYGVCMDKEQAESFDDTDWYTCTIPSLPFANERTIGIFADPSDTTCLLATLTGDAAGCEGTTDSEGKSCDWCSFQGYDFCLNNDQAEIAEQVGASCGDREEDRIQEKEPIDNVVDPSDNTCLLATLTGDKAACKGTTDSEGKSCDWCSLQGYDFCLNDDQAQIAEQLGASCSDQDESVPGKEDNVVDPSDQTCILATLTGDEASCKGTTDSEGKSCDWCSLQGYDFCLNDDQAQIAEQLGASCSDQDESVPEKKDNVVDPSDQTCLLATLTGDEAGCKGTTDSEGKSCDWCSLQGYDFCLNDDQAQIAEQLGASCSDQDESIPEKEDNVVDPSDQTCILATLTGDEASCKGTMDSEGKPCDWCSLQGFDFCLDDDQAQIAEQLGASCSEGNAPDVATDTLSDPSDPSCLFITINGDESACRGSTDVDGKACEWCSFQSYEFCLNVDQAESVEQYGVTCNEEAPVDDAKKDLSDPMDTQCLAATVGGDESQCQEAMDSSGKPCEWCSFQSYAFCLNVDQAQLVEQYGAECGDDRDGEAKDISTSVA